MVATGEDHLTQLPRSFLETLTKESLINLVILNQMGADEAKAAKGRYDEFLKTGKEILFEPYTIEIEALKAENSTLRCQLTMANVGFTKNVQDEILDLTKRLHGRETELMKFSNENDELKKELERLKSNNVQLSSMVDTLRAAIERLSRESADHVGERYVLGEKIEKRDKKIAELEKLVSEKNEKLKQQEYSLKCLNEDMCTWEGPVAAAKRLKTEVAELKASNEHKFQMIQDGQTAAERLRQENEQLKTHIEAINVKDSALLRDGALALQMVTPEKLARAKMAKAKADERIRMINRIINNP